MIGKGTENIDGLMGKNTGDQAATAKIDHNKEETNQYSKCDLEKNLSQRHADAVKEIEDVACAEGQAGNNNRSFQTLSPQRLKEEAPENQLFQKADAEHQQNVKTQFCR